VLRRHPERYAAFGLFKEKAMKSPFADKLNPLLLLSCLLAALLTVPAQTLAQTTHNVTVGDNFFNPSSLVIAVGDTVRWNNAAGGAFHDVTADDGSFGSVTATSFTFERTFNTVEEVDYFCTVHPTTMQGSVSVIQGGGPLGADLSLEEVSAPSGTFAPGDLISIGIEIMNIGGQASGGFGITYYASNNATISSTDTVLGTENRPGLNAGQDLSYTAAATLPANMEDGLYFIGAIIDIVDENGENNVNLDDEPLTVASPVSSADLSITGVAAPASPVEQGQAVSIRSETRNIGTQMSDPYRITFYISDDDNINSQDIRIGTESRGGLAPGERDIGFSSAMIPVDLAAGDYFIGAIIDSDDGNLNNNVNHDPESIRVNVAGSDGTEFNAGHNGNWWNGLARNGEGVQVELGDDGAGGVVFVATVYSYDTLGNQIFLIAVGTVNGDTATVEVFITDGGLWGDDFDPALVTETRWGSGTFVASGCELILMNLVPNAQFQGMGYTNLMYELVRLITPIAPCPIPNPS
jgi:plastocyanin